MANNERKPKLSLGGQPALGRRTLLFSLRGVLLPIGFNGHRYPLLLPVDICYRQCPEGNQIDSRTERGHKRWQKLPVPAKEVCKHASNTKIEYVVSGRCGPLDEQG